MNKRKKEDEDGKLDIVDSPYDKIDMRNLMVFL